MGIHCMHFLAFSIIFKAVILRNVNSNLNVISGEDLSAKERKKLQQEQMREWIKQQLNEKNREKDAEKYADM